jgi:hypothetical protein
MRPRARLLLAAVISALLCVPAPACSHDDGAKSDAEVDWSAFTPVAPPGEAALNISDVERETGLPLALPSYLPEGMSRNLDVSPPENNTGEAQYAKTRVTLFPTRRDGLWIYIDEALREPGTPQRVYPSRSELAKIGRTDVACWVEPPQSSPFPTPPPPQPTEDPDRYPWLSCMWDTDKLNFDVDFRWGSPQPVPDEIAPESRNEAMKVIASMIEEPYIP